MNEKREMMKQTAHDPTTVLVNLFKKVENRIKITFFCAIGAGLLAHVYQFTNKLFNYDELGHTPGGFGSGIELGRWGLELFGRLTSLFFGNYSLPMVNGMIALLFFAISACLILSILDIKDGVFAGITGALCTVFPAVTSTYFFMYTAPYYALALLLSCLAAWFVIKYPAKWQSYVFGVLLLALSTGIYQSYFSIAVCLVLADLILRCMDGQQETTNPEIVKVPLTTKESDPWKAILKTGLQRFLFLIAGLLLYFLINKAVLFFSGIAMLDYQGLSDMGKVGVFELLSSVLRGYSDFLRMIRADVLQTNPTILVKGGIFVLGIGVLAALVKTLADKRKATPIKVLLLIFVLLFPIAVFLVYVMAAGGAFVYTLMSYSLVFMFLVPLAVIEHVWMRSEEHEKKERQFQTVFSWSGSIAGIVAVLVYIWFANGNYQALQYTDYHDLAYYTVMMTQVKSLDGYQDNLPVAIIGEEITDETNRAGSLMGTSFAIGGKGDTNVSSYSNLNILTQYLGFMPSFLWEDDLEEISEKEAVKAMPCYPTDGAIAIVDGVIVIKLQDE